MAHEGAGGHDLHVLVGHHLVEHGVAVDGGVLHEDAVFDLRALLNADAPEENGVLHRALDGASVGHQAVAAGAVGVDVGGCVVALFGVDGPLGVEDLPADGGVQQLHTAHIVVLEGVDLGGVAVPDEAADVEGARLGLEHRAAEAAKVVAHALVHQLQQEILGEDVHLQRAVAPGGIVEGIERLSDPALAVQTEVCHIVRAVHTAGADGGDVRAGVQMGLIDLLEGDVDDEVAVGQDHMGLPHALQVRAHPGQGLHLAPEGPHAAGLLIGEGGQEAQSAVLAAQIPVLAGAQVVQKALIVPVEHHAHVGDPSVDHAAEDEVDDPVAPGKGNRGGHPVGGQLPQAVVLLIGEDDPMQAFHLVCTSL